MIARLAALALAAPLTIAAPALADSPAICHPVNGNGQTGYGWNVISPDRASVHIDEVTGAGKHVSHDGRTDVYAADGVCPGAPVEPTEEPTEEPSEQPSTDPTPAEPTTEPSVEPTETVTEPEPSGTPTSEPTPEPTDEPEPVTGGGSEPKPTHDVTAPPVTVEQSCSPRRCVRIERDETGTVTDRRVTTYPSNLKESGL